MAEVDSGSVEPQARHIVYCGGEYPGPLSRLSPLHFAFLPFQVLSC